MFLTTVDTGSGGEGKGGEGREGRWKNKRWLWLFSLHSQLHLISNCSEQLQLPSGLPYEVGFQGLCTCSHCVGRGRVVQLGRAAVLQHACHQRTRSSADRTTTCHTMRRWWETVKELNNDGYKHEVRHSGPVW